jgi:hypothetical protein
VYALNLTRSPENVLILGVSRSFHYGRRRNRRRDKDERGLSPRGLRQHRAVQRFASNQASDEQGLLGKRARQVPEYVHQCKKRGIQMAASRVMGTGTPQWLAEKRGNARRAKVPTDGRSLKRKHCRYARSE